MDEPDEATWAASLPELLAVLASNPVPGRTRIAIRDYQCFWSYQTAVVMDAIGPSVALEPVAAPVDADAQPNAVSFLVVGPIDPESVDTVIDDLVGWSSQQVHATWARIMEPLHEQARARMAPGLALFLYDAGHQDEALGVLAETPMDKPVLDLWKRAAEAKPSAAGDRPALRYPRLFALMRLTRLDPAREPQNAGLRQSVMFALSLDVEADPRRYLEAWKQVLTLDPSRSNAAKRAAKRVVSTAQLLGDQSELVHGLAALLAITPEDEKAKVRLASTALGARQEHVGLDCLARLGLADLTVAGIDRLHERVCEDCEDAVRAGDDDLALRLFESLQQVDDKHPRLEALRPSVIGKSAQGGASV